MNIITISRLEDFQEVIEALPVFSKNQSKEIDHNMWCIALEDNFVMNVTLEDLNSFLDSLIKTRKYQLDYMDIKKDVIFYMWFDKQALQLRCNILTGNLLSKLPFRCKIRIIYTPDSIFANFITAAQNFFQHGSYVEFFNKGDEGWDEDDDEEEYTLDVFVKILSPLSN